MRQCPRCYRQNPDEATFCGGCGARLTQPCPACGQTVMAEARYCPHCGAAMQATPMIERLARQLSPEVRLGLTAVLRGVGATMLALAVFTFVLTPPPRILDDVSLLLLGTLALALGQILKPGDKVKRRGGIEVIPPDEPIEVEMPGE